MLISKMVLNWTLASVYKLIEDFIPADCIAAIQSWIENSVNFINKVHIAHPKVPFFRPDGDGIKKIECLYKQLLDDQQM